MAEHDSGTHSDSELAPVIIIIFGITGDLSQRKLLPALYHLFKDDLLHPDSVILGITRRDVTAEELLSQVELCVNEIDNVCDPDGIRKIQAALQMHTMDLDAGQDYDALLARINTIEENKGYCMNRMYYLSIPPKTMQPIVRNLGAHGHNKGCQHNKAEARLLVEKPFGYDMASAEKLIAETGEWFGEDQLYRIDHYVAKETVQNILAFRQYNPLIEAIWSQQYIESITITAFEQISIEGRAVFYEGVGALRDFIQSHLLQLLTVVTMELPNGQSSEAVHTAKQELLEHIATITPDEVASCAVRGQYEGYRDEVKNPDSHTETYASLQLLIDTARWHDIPISIRTGKALAQKCTEVEIAFRKIVPTDFTVPDNLPGAGDDVAANKLTFTIQPVEGISLKLNAKRPGFDDQLQSVAMDFNYQTTFDDNGHPDAYERVLVDAAKGDHTLFTTSQEILEAWRVVEHVLEAWEQSAAGLIAYPQGSATVGSTDLAQI